MRIIEITESKQSELADMCEEMLTIGGRLMSCIREMGEDNDRMGERSPYYGDRMGMRGRRMGGRYGNRYDEPEPDMPDYDRMGERRMYRKY